MRKQKLEIEQRDEKNDIYDIWSQTFSNLSPQLVEMELLLLPVKHPSLDEETLQKTTAHYWKIYRCGFCLIIAVVII